MNEQQILQLASEVLKIKPLHATHMTSGGMNVTYDVALPDQNVIIRANSHADLFAKTEHNLAVLRGLQLPVPLVLASDLTKTRYPFAYLILDKIPGRDLRYQLSSMSHAQMTRLAEQIISFQRKVATLPEGRGFGYVAIGKRGTHSTWWELIRPAKILNESVAPTTVIEDWESRILRLVATFEPYFLQVPPICFLDDITTKNVIVENGELQGLVDFDCVCYGDPLYWLGLTATSVVSDVGTSELFYVEELIRCWALTEEQKRIFSLYAAWMSLSFVQRFAATETEEWGRRMLHAMEQWVTAVQ